MLNYLEFKEAKCKNCYKCLKFCPVKAIKIEDNQAKIMEDKCILCGRCTLVCPQNAKKVHSEIEVVKELLKNNKVIASVAPSFISSFNLKSFDTFNRALQKLGFAFGEETARGAKIVVDSYERLLEEKKYKNFITSCCPAVNRMISLYYPDALKYLAPIDTPMLAHAKLLKKENPDAKIIFIGPCIAKKREGKESGIIDGVLTFEDMIKLFDEANISFDDEVETGEANFNKARFFPISRGIIKSFDRIPEGYEYIAVDGTEKCMEVLKEIESYSNVFLELNVCESSCVNGPCSLNKNSAAIKSNAAVREYVKRNVTSNASENIGDVNFEYEHKKIDLDIIKPTEEQIKEVLARTGKFTKEDELNCGACGYPTCREKAIAVINGFADIEMCLPYMRERAENMSTEIIKQSPNGIVVIDKDYKIIDINAKAKSLLGVRIFKSKEYSILDLVSDNVDFVLALENMKDIYSKRIYIEKTNSYVELSITHMKEHDMMFAIMKDITEKAKYDEKLGTVKAETLKAADEVIKKHMRVAQEIASLLGETTAETKVALVNLKKALEEENLE